MKPSIIENPLFVRRLLGILLVAGLLVAAYFVVTTAYIYRTTGSLEVDASDPQTVLSITGQNRQAKLIGLGSAHVRLAPGTYQVYGSQSVKSATAIVVVTKQHLTNVQLQPVTTALPSVLTVHFGNFSSLIDGGITSGQLSNLEEIFFHYKPTAKNITIQSGSIGQAPESPDGGSANFTTSFTVSVDGTSYSAVIIYAITDDIRLTLTNPNSHQLVYDSGSSSSQPEGD